MNDKLLRLPAVLAMIGLRKTWVYGAINKGRFPKPIHVGRAALWRQSDVACWMAQQAPGNIKTDKVGAPRAATREDFAAAS